MYAKVSSWVSSALSKRNIMLLAVGFAIFLTSGGVYLIVSQPGALSSGGSFLVRSSSSQTSIEFFTTFFLTVAGTTGFYFLERALQRSFDINASKMKYLMAVIMILLAVIVMEYMLYAKLT